MHTQQALTAIKVKVLHDNYKKLVQAKKECTEKLKEVVLNCDLAEGEVKDDSPLAKAAKTATEAQAKAKSVVEHMPTGFFSSVPTSFWRKQDSPAIKSWLNKLIAAHGRT